MQSKMTNACPDLKITVFGRFRDFVEKTKETPPSAILSKTSVVKHINGYSVCLHGVRKGSTEEPYVLLSVDKKIDSINLVGITLGVIDILGSKGTKQFVAQYFATKPRLKRVTKIEDLLPLLTFDIADAVLIPENYIRYFKQISNLNFVINPVQEMTAGIVVLAVKDGCKSLLTISSIKGLGDVENALFEVENWK